MATRPGDINAEIGVQLDAQGMSGNLRTLNEQISNIITALNQAGKAAEQAIQLGGKAGAEAAQQLRQQLQALGQTQNALKTLTTSNVRNTFGGLTSADQVGKMVSGWNKFFQGLGEGAPTVDKLASRLKLLNLEIGSLAQAGAKVPTNMWQKQLNVEGALNTFKTIESAHDKFIAKISQLTPQNQSKLSPLLEQYTAAATKFDQLAANPRSNASLSAQAQTLKEITAQIETQLRLVQQEDTAYRSLYNATVRQGQAILDATASQRELNLRTQANRYSTMMSGVGIGQFNEELGDPSTRLKNAASATDALSRATRLAAQTRIQLNAAMESNAPQQRIEQLIARYKNLTDLEALALALQQKQNTSGGTGFFSGVVQGIKGTIPSIARGDSVAGGIGASLGRAAAYTLEYSTLYRTLNLVTGSLSEAIKFTIQWEDQLAQLQAISGATNSEMGSLSQTILDVAKNSASSVSEITDASKILAQAGYSAKETAQLLQNVVDLSAASGSSPAESVDILTSAMGAFDLQVSDAAHITDALVTTLNKTKLSATQVQLGLQYLGATAKENNLTFEDLVATLGTAADAGIRAGSTMSTGTRQLLIGLQEPTKKLSDELKRIGLTMADVDVQTHGFVGVLDTLHEHGFNAFSSLETRAAAMYEVLSNNTDEMRQLRQETLQTNIAHEAAAKRLTSLNAQWTEFKNKMSAVAADMGKTLIPLFKSFLQLLLDLGTQLSLITQKFSDVQNSLNSFATGAHNNAVDRLNELFGDLGLNIHLAHAEATGASDAMDTLQTKFDDASAAVNDQKQHIKGLEDEYKTIISRMDELNKRPADLKYEIDRLSSRFPGLREELQKTGQTAQDLAQALLNLDQQAASTLAHYTGAEAKAANQTAALGRQQLTQSYDTLKAKYGDNPQLMGILNDLYAKAQPGKHPDWQVLYDRGITALNMFSHNVAIDKDTRTETTNDFNDLISQLQATQDALNTRDRDLQAIAKTAYMRTPAGSQEYGRVLADQARANDINVAVEGLDLEGRRSKIKGLLDDLDNTIAYLVRRLAAVTNKNAQAAIQNMINTERATRQRVASLGQPTDEEQRALDSAQNREDHIRTMTSDEMAAALQKAFPGIGISSGYRGPDTDLGRRFPGSWHTNMPGGHAVDITRLPPGITLDDIFRFMESKGQQIDINNPNSFSDEFKHPIPGHTTGGNYHIGWMAKNSHAQSQAMADLRHQQEEAARTQQQIEQESLDAAKRRLSTMVDNLSKETDITKVEDDIGKIEDQFQQVKKKTEDKARADLARNKIDEKNPLYKLRMDAVADDLAAQHEQLLRQEAQSLVNAIGKIITDTEKFLDYSFRQQMQVAQSNANRQAGLLAGLDNPRLAGLVPNYTKTIQQRRSDLANQDLTEANVAANEAKLRGLNDLLNSIQTNWTNAAKMYPEAAALGYTDYATKVMDVQNAITDLSNEQEKLVAQTQSIDLVPKNWADAIGQAAQAWQIANNGGITLNQRMWNELGDTLDSVHGAFTQFFTDILTGSANIGKAFGNMAKAVIQALEEMAAKAIATQIFSLLLSFVPGAAGPATTSDAATFSSIMGFGYRGGLVANQGKPIQRYALGGYVDRGLPTRDSVPALLSRGEFVMQRSAAESIGHKLLMDMNNRGAAALNKLGQAPIVMPQGAPQETNVWVVIPEEKPIPGPNDILAVVHNDVLRNGATKQLIKKVVQGG